MNLMLKLKKAYHVVITIKFHNFAACFTTDNFTKEFIEASQICLVLA